MAEAFRGWTRRRFLKRIALFAGPQLTRAAGGSSSFTPYESAKPVLDAFAGRLPRELANPTPGRWNAWNRANDRAIRGRLERGDLDTLVNFLLYGTSFTAQPRIHIPDLVKQTRDGVLRARVTDLVRGLESPGGNERLVILRALAEASGQKLNSEEDRDKTGRFILQNLTRVLEEKRTFAERSASAAGSALDERAGLFRDRGVSLDTGILADFSIDLALGRLRKRNILAGAPAMRVAVIGPGLNFIDKDEGSAFDYFPLQTLQPFALIDSIRQLQIAERVRLTVFDISPLVIRHLRRASERAGNGSGYTVQLPRDIGRTWPPVLDDYWRRLGTSVGKDVAPLPPSPVFDGLASRAIEIRPEVVLDCHAEDLDIIAQRRDMAMADRFDLVVATNVFVYYGGFEQALALGNVSPMLKPGGILLANDRLPVLPGSGVEVVGITEISDGAAGRDAVVAYRKR